MKRTNKRTFSSQSFLRWFKKMAKPGCYNFTAIIDEGIIAFNEGREHYEMSSFDSKTGRPEVFSFR